MNVHYFNSQQLYKVKCLQFMYVQLLFIGINYVISLQYVDDEECMEHV